jgi:hypothetical protein
MGDLKKEKKLSASIGIVLFLTLTILFLGIIVYGTSVWGSIILFFLGAAIVVGLSAYAVRQNNSIKKLFFPIIVATGASIVVLLSAILIGNVLIHEMPATFTYTVSVNGLEEYNGGQATDIIVPVPMVNGNQAFGDDELQYRQFGQWKSMLVVTPQGKMIAFQSLDQNLTNIHAQWFRETRGKKITIEPSSYLLSPKINKTATIISPGLYPGENGDGYVSQVYIDDVIQPLETGNGTIYIDLSFFVSEGTYLGFRGNAFNARVSEEIPQGVKQMIPVDVKIEKVV